MGRFRRLAPVLLGCALLACSKSAPSEAVPERAVRAPAAAQPESLYDAQGRLKPSAEHVDWLQIPAGFRRKPSVEERRIRFEAETLVPLDKLRDFLSARMFTGVVEESSYRVFYRAVMPIDSDPKAVRMNIVLAARPALNSTVLEIERLSYGDAKPLTVDEARRVLARERAQAE